MHHYQQVSTIPPIYPVLMNQIPTANQYNRKLYNPSDSITLTAQEPNNNAKFNRMQDPYNPEAYQNNYSIPTAPFEPARSRDIYNLDEKQKTCS